MSINTTSSSSSSCSSHHSEAKSSPESLSVPFKAMGTISQPKPLDNHHKAAITTADNDDYHVGDPAIANMIGQDLIFMKEAMAEVQKYADHMNLKINQACEKFEELKTGGGGGSDSELGELKKAVKKLKSQIPSKLRIHYNDDSKPHRNPWFDGSINSNSHIGHTLHNMYKDTGFRPSSTFENIKVSFDGLPEELKACLNCFLWFPQMVIIKKRLVIYWWIGEGVVPPSPISMDQKTKQEIALGKMAEDFGNEFLDQLIAKGFIEPIYKNCGLKADSYKMSPIIHSALTIVTSGFDFSRYYIPTYPLRYGDDYLLNVSAAIIDGRFEFELFSKGNHFKIVYLGRWQNSVSHHIEVADTKILNGLKNMKQLRFLSLRGISLITELPEFISQLTNLKILDLRACHNLEVVPDGIGLLKSLTHLDISECYLLDHMPKWIGSLSELEFFKGFIFGDSKDKKSSCTFDDLTKLPKLRKLSIYTSTKEFPTNKQLHHLQRLKTLQKLKISWSRCILRGETDDTPKQSRPRPRLRARLTKALTRSFTKQHDSEIPLQLELPSSLQKLELECFPEMITPSWLWSSNLKNLKKLYIRGGLLCYLGPIATTTVQMLQLKYLSKLEMHWFELMVLFPNLIYLEKIECPGLTCFPCDEDGVWTDRANTQN